MGLAVEDVHNTLLEMKMQLLDLQGKVDVLIRCVEEGRNGPNEMGLGNVRGMGNEIRVLLKEDGPGSTQVYLGPNQGKEKQVYLGPNQRHQKAGPDPNLMGCAKGVKNNEKLRAEAPPVWRAREGGEAGTSASGDQPTLPETELGFTSYPPDTHRSCIKMMVAQRSSLTAMEDLRDGDDVVEVSRTTG